jgi:hypothetical protein
MIHLMVLMLATLVAIGSTHNFVGQMGHNHSLSQLRLSVSHVN